MTLLIVYAVLAIGFSFLCSMLEATLLSLTRSQIESMVERGSRAGKRLREMKKHIDRPLAAILTVNTISHTVGAAGVGAQAAIVWGSASVGIASAVMTLLILVFSEIIPKTLGAVHARTLAPFAALTIRIMTVVCLPLIIPLEYVNRLIAKDNGASSAISRAEMLATLRLGWSSGALHQREFAIASNLMKLSTLRVMDVMTPRTVVFAWKEDLTVSEALDSQVVIPFSRIPIHAGTTDQVTGYVMRHDLSLKAARGRKNMPIKRLAKPMPIFPETSTVGDALDAFLGNKHQIATVVDEYGGLAGLVTLEDLVESLLGEEIVDESDTVEDMRALARERSEAKRREREQQRKLEAERAADEAQATDDPALEADVEPATPDERQP